MGDDSDTDTQAAAIDEASAIAMDRYELSEPKALALLGRLARRRKVDVGVVAAALVAATLARRRRDRALRH